MRIAMRFQKLIRKTRLSDLMISLSKNYNKRYFLGLFLMLMIISFYGCGNDGVSVSNDGDSKFNTEKEWLVPEHEVLDGGPGKDGIPPIENPKFNSVSEADFIPDERRVLGIKRHGNPRAYPHQILDWHEIVNENINGSNISITYCPLTATGIAWIPRNGPDFGTSGLIFRNNLIAYDRRTGSLWSQMRLRAINGPDLGESMEPLNVIDTNWKTWKAMYPDSDVLSTDTGHSRDYNSYAYGKDFSTIDGIIVFPTTNETDKRLNNKARVHAIFPQDSLHENSKVRVYEYSKFGENITVISDSIDGNNYLIVGSTSYDFVVAYRSELRNGVELSFEAVQDELPIIMQDNEGNKWDLFGEAVEGPRSGERLIPARSYSGYWYGFRDMFNQPEIYEFK